MAKRTGTAGKKLTASQKVMAGVKLGRQEEVELRVSEALKGVSRWKRYDRAARFVKKMRAAEARVRHEGARVAGAPAPWLAREAVNALCWGVGDERNRELIQRYRRAAQAAERFMKA